MLISLTHQKVLDLREALLCIFMEGHVIYSGTEVTDFLETIYVSNSHCVDLLTYADRIILFCFMLSHTKHKNKSEILLSYINILPLRAPKRRNAEVVTIERLKIITAFQYFDTFKCH